MTPTVSVVMAAHDSAQTIEAAIASVRLQTRRDWELIVVDDGSTDETAAVAAAVPDDRIRIVTQSNRGAAAARNAGLRSARAPLVSTLDSDDLWLPSYLETMVQALAEAPDVAVAYTDAWVLDDATGRVRKTTEMTYQRPPIPPPTAHRELLKELLRRNFVYNSVTARRDALLAVGGYDERLWNAQDWELWLRVAASGRRFLRVPGTLAVHRDHPGSLSTDLERARRAVQQVYRIVEEDWEIDDEIRTLSRQFAERGRSLRMRDVVARVTRPARSVMQRRTLWHRQPPPEVAALFAAVATESASPR